MAHRRTIAETFRLLRERRHIALMPFIPAGYPDLKTTAALLPAIEAGGASLIEVGFPFSDPVADGPTIQAAFTAALASKVTVDDIFTCIASARDTVSIPLVAMVSYSIVYRYGLGRFVDRAKSAGFDGLILPDLPVPEADPICKTVRDGGLDTVLLVAPDTSAARREKIIAASSGFIYYLSVAGITGQRDRFPDDLAKNVQNLRQEANKPVCVGFGIHTPQQIAELAPLADGAIVGSAVVSRLNQHLGEPVSKIAEAVENYCRELLRLSR